MDVHEEEWLTTGQAAKVAARDIRTIRRWVEEGRLKARVSPGGHRQIALSSLLEAQRPTRGSSRRRRRGQGRVLPSECLDTWADVAADWATWRPPPTTGDAALREMIGQVEDVRQALDDVYEALADALTASPPEALEKQGVLDWLRTMPSSSNLPPR
jgi:hypothetical protein